jgi:amidase
MDDMHYLNLLDIGRQIQSRERTSTEVTEALLARIETCEPTLHSFVTRMADAARVDAQRADTEIAAGKARGPLHGVPVAVKDLLWTAGVPTSHGMPLLKDFRPDEDATVVRRLREAGAVILGKLQQTEGAFADHHPAVTPPTNPWGPALWSGASSSGSGVATASGLCFGSLGTDTGGSIRFPSAANGITGLKPTWGRVSRFGAFELAASLDHIGPMARSAADCGAMLAAIAGADPRDPTAAPVAVPDYLATMTRGLEGLRVGIDPAWAIDLVDATTQTVMREALKVVEDCGARVRDIAFPDTAQSIADWTPLCAVETAVAHEATFPSRRAEYGPGLAALIDMGRGLSGMDLQKMALRRADLTGRVRTVFESVDLVLVPAMSHAAPTRAFMSRLGEDADLLTGLLRYTCPFDLTGSPTLTLPGGQTGDGVPVAFQFVAPHFAEDLLVRAGWAFQRATHWHRRRPPV